MDQSGDETQKGSMDSQDQSESETEDYFMDNISGHFLKKIPTGLYKNFDQFMLNLVWDDHYLSTLANSTLIILFSEMLKFSNCISFKSKNIGKEK